MQMPISDRPFIINLLYQKLMKANDELINKVQLYKEMVSLRDKVI